MRFFILVYFTISLCRAWADNDLPATAKGQMLASELLQNLQAFGSFQAEYYVINHEKSAGIITAIFNEQNKYCLVKMADFKTKSPDVYGVFDYAQLAGTLAASKDENAISHLIR